MRNVAAVVLLPPLLYGLSMFLLEPVHKPEKDEKPAELVVKSGIYHVSGEHARGQYEGAVSLRKTGDVTYQLTYDTGAVGFGIRKGKELSVGWHGRAVRGGGVTVYTIGADSLEGIWTAGNGETYPETLEFLKELKK